MSDRLKGNQFWKLRSRHGRKALFETPELLWQAACEYFEWCNNNPIETVVRTTSSTGSSDVVKTHERPFTKQGLFFYIQCSEDWLRNFRKNCSVDFLRVIEAIEQTIVNQQVEHAMVGVFNSNLVARLNGIKEQTDLTTNGEAVNSNTIVNIGKETIQQISKSLEDEY